ncbi:hypothetical protein FBZ89_13240 [Nitrospirillum amazonense]|uniref:Uncharacterized protein n=1 Tax=Nitrospirillum amazonense TaxID=28077 RepID=A0A560EN13_9PROT|nr:hypothetical protein [Nitrospirillum amazonense]TWB10771.1 hypothetical protein FBZ89_13240 [Nitrospirillum amazonense]
MKKGLLAAGAICAVAIAGFVIWGMRGGGASGPLNPASGNKVSPVADAPKWQVIGGLEAGVRNVFIQISPSAAKDRSAYDEALAAVCSGESGCLVAFFLPGDKVPPNEPMAKFMSEGGWRNYHPVAYWFNNAFTDWDCERAGDKGAPLNAMCGAFVEDAYSAILSVSSRTKLARFCGWGDKGEVASVKAYISKMKDPARREQFSSKFDKNLSETYGGEASNCVALRSDVEARSEDALKFLAEHQI